MKKKLLKTVKEFLEDKEDMYYAWCASDGYLIEEDYNEPVSIDTNNLDSFINVIDKRQIIDADIISSIDCKLTISNNGQLNYMMVFEM